MTTSLRETTAKSRLAEEKLRDAYPTAKVDAYCYNLSSIRVRIVDEQFRLMTQRERINSVSQKLQLCLPMDVRRDVIFLLVLAPGEEKDSMMNLEFEDPSDPQL